MEIGVRIVGFILLIIDYISRPFYWLIALKPLGTLPPVQDPLLLTSATKLAEQIRKKHVTSQLLVETFIQRIKEVNPLINAVVEERFTEAIEEAKKVDKILEKYTDEDALKQLEKDSPFLGVPVTVKESCAVRGMSQCVGSLPRIGEKASQDGHAVALMRSSGAIPLLVSNTPEICLSWETTNFVTGRTNNPYCLQRTCGGSSGGEAALIGSGASVIGVASDIAGSIRIPAMFNGIFGHKPSPGVVSITGHYPSSTDESFAKFLTVGPLTRYSEDLEPMLRVMSGKNADMLEFDKPVDIKNLKVAYMMEAGKSLVLIPVDPDIQAAMKRAIQYLSNVCESKIEEVHIPEMENSVEISVSVFFGMQDIPNMLQDENNPKISRNVFVEMLKTMFGIGMFSLQSLGFYLLHTTNLFIPRHSYKDYCKQADNLKQKIENTIGENGVFLYPTFPIPAFYHNQVFTKPAGVLYAMLFNVLGLPSTHVPLGLDSNGLPIGIQVIAAPKKDRLCLAVARELEKGFGGWVRPPSTIK